MCDEFVRNGFRRLHSHPFKGVSLQTESLSGIEGNIRKRVTIGRFGNSPTECSNVEAVAVGTKIVDQHNSLAVLNIETQTTTSVVRVQIAIDDLALCYFR